MKTHPKSWYDALTDDELLHHGYMLTEYDPAFVIVLLGRFEDTLNEEPDQSYLCTTCAADIDD